jgi:hypothetical protein
LRPASNLGSFFDAPEPTGFYTTDIQPDAEFFSNTLELRPDFTS